MVGALGRSRRPRLPAVVRNDDLDARPRPRSAAAALGPSRERPRRGDLHPPCARCCLAADLPRRRGHRHRACSDPALRRTRRPDLAGRRLPPLAGDGRAARRGPSQGLPAAPRSEDQRGPGLDLRGALGPPRRLSQPQTSRRLGQCRRGHHASTLVPTAKRASRHSRIARPPTASAPPAAPQTAPRRARTGLGSARN